MYLHTGDKATDENSPQGISDINERGHGKSTNPWEWVKDK
jgi:hypothetical protein